MAPRNKLLETIDGEPMVRHVANIALASGAQMEVATDSIFEDVDAPSELARFKTRRAATP
jgi:CMP-2-keto-3-deoxyoctulosonic acid synthetase